MHDPPHTAGLSGFVRRLANDNAPDADLLRRYAATRDETAFATLVRRHGPIVWRVCRGLVRQSADAEDAYQATFLLLIRNAAKVRNPAVVGAWLYGTAVKVATKARSKRQPEQLEVEPMTVGDITVREAESLFHEELATLPAKFRDPLVLCCLEGLARDDAAKRLGVSVEAGKHALERGRELLKARLLKRGIAVSVPLLAGLLAPSAGAGGPEMSVNGVSTSVVSLANEVSNMAITKWKLAAAVGLAAVTVGGFGAGVVFGQGTKPAPAAPPAVKAKADDKDGPAAVAKRFLTIALDQKGNADDALKLCEPGRMTAADVTALRGRRVTAPAIDSLTAEARVVLARGPDGKVSVAGREVPGRAVVLLMRDDAKRWVVLGADIVADADESAWIGRLNRLNKTPIEVATEFVTLALAGNIADAHKLCPAGGMTEKKVAEVMTRSGLKSAKFTVILVSDRRVELVSELATVTIKGSGVTAEGHMVFTVEPDPKTGVWEVKDADFADAKKVAGKLDRYLEGKVKPRPAPAMDK